MTTILRMPDIRGVSGDISQMRKERDVNKIVRIGNVKIL